MPGHHCCSNSTTAQVATAKFKCRAQSETASVDQVIPSAQCGVPATLDAVTRVRRYRCAAGTTGCAQHKQQSTSASKPEHRTQHNTVRTLRDTASPGSTPGLITLSSVAPSPTPSKPQAPQPRSLTAVQGCQQKPCAAQRRRHTLVRCNGAAGAAAPVAEQSIGSDSVCLGGCCRLLICTSVAALKSTHSLCHSTRVIEGRATLSLLAWCKLTLSAVRASPAAAAGALSGVDNSK